MHRFSKIVLLALVVGVAPVWAADDGAERHDVVLFDHAGSKDWQRIPSIAITNGGTLLIFAQHRKGGVGDFGHDSTIVVYRSTDHGQTWSDARVIAEQRGIDIHSGPVVVDRRNGRVLKFCRYWPNTHAGAIREKTYAAMREKGWIDHVMMSDDDGATWSPPTPIEMPFPTGARYTGTGNGVHGVQLGSGRLLIQGGFVAGDGPHAGQNHVCNFYSDDGGATWRLGATAPSKSMREYQMAPLADGRVYFNIRNHRSGLKHHRRVVAWSDDPVATFGGFEVDDELPEPVCHAGLATVPDAIDGGGDWLVFSNPDVMSRKGGKYDGDARRRMTVRLSRDGGRTWPTKHLVYAGRAGYSDLAVAPDGWVHVVYERGKDRYQQQIAYARFRLATLHDGGK